MTTIRIGLIGAGANMRKRHLPGFQGIDGVEVVCVANRTTESAEKVAAEYGVANVHAHWTDVAGDPDIDAVCIGTWPNLHAPATCAALRAGKHVLCEARMADSVASAQEMLAVSQRCDRVAMLVPSPFGLKGDRVMRELVAGGFLGDVREIYVRGLSASMADPSAPLHWRQRADLSGLNILVLGILNETVQRWFGRTESVAAQTALFTPRRVDAETGDWRDVDIPDSVAVLARMATGAQCVYHVSGHARHGGGPSIEAYGSAGTVVYDLANDVIMAAKSGDDGLRPLPIPAEKAGGWRVEEDFIASIRESRPVTLTNFADGLKYMRFTAAVRQSADTGRRVALSEV